MPPPVLADQDDTWRDFAYCKGNPNAVDLMFRHDCIYDCSTSNGRRCEEDPRVAQAKSMCDSCPVLDHCRWWSVVTNQTYGVSGGMTYAQRLVVRKALRKHDLGRKLLKGEVEITWQ